MSPPNDTKLTLLLNLWCSGECRKQNWK